MSLARDVCVGNRSVGISPLRICHRMGMSAAA
jgi:hypothetical protein